MAFAKADDVADRLGRELTAPESRSVEFLVDAASAAIAVEIGRTEDELDPAPDVLKGICVSMVLRALSNPSNLASSSESLGAYSYSQTFSKDAGTDQALTENEVAIARRAVYGRLSGSARADTKADTLYDPEPA